MQWWIKFALWIVALSIAVPPLVDRIFPLILVYKNSGDRLPNISAFSDYKIQFQNQVRNCEDVHLDEELGIAYLSCDPGRDRWNTVMGITRSADWTEGRIYYYEYAKSGFKNEGSVHQLPVSGLYSSKTQPNTLHPLGMGLHRESKTLFVVNLGRGGPAIEVIQLDGKGTSGVHKETLKHPLIASPNSIWPLGEHEILFTNDHRWTGLTNPVLSKLENLAVIPGGSVVYYNLKTKEAKKLWSIPFANGVAALNKTHIAVASTTMPAVLVFEFDRDAKALALKQTLRPTFWADNLSVDAAGKLLVAGHPHPFLLQRAAEGNQFYDVDGTGEADLRPGSERPRSPSWVVEWDGNAEGKLTNLFVGHDFGSSTSAVRDLKRGVGFVSGLYEKGVMMWKE